MMAAALAAPPTTPREVVQSAINRVITILRGPVSSAEESNRESVVSPDKQRAELREVANELFDFEEMARRTLPRHWAARSPQERREFVRLFTDLLERSYIHRIETYAGERMAFLGETLDGKYATVKSKIITKRRTETALNYQLHVKSGEWKVYDVLIDGVSFISTYRSEFDRIIKSSSYANLVDRLRKKRMAAITIGGRPERP